MDRLALLKGEGEGEGWASASGIEQLCEMVFVGSKTPHLSPLPFCKRRGDRPHTVFCPLRSLQGQAARDFMEKLVITRREKDEHVHWGKFAERDIPETLVAQLEELATEF